jgi:hypothetical protein
MNNMKRIHKIAALTLALGAASAVQAVDIYITGSTAFRAQVYAGLGDMNLAVQQAKTSGDNTFTFVGRVADPLHIGFSADEIGQTYTVYCSFSGSVEGLQALISPGYALYDLPGPAGAGQFMGFGVDFAFSDVLQSSTQLALQPTQLLVSLPADSDIGGVAVQPFCIAGNAAAGAKISNVTSYNVLDIYDYGGIDLTLLSGNPADASTQVIGCGRYDLSGTRVTTELDNNDPNDINDALLQYALASSQNQTPPGLVSTDSNSPAGTYWAALASQNDSNGNPLDNAGTNGYFTGGNVAAALDYSSVHSTQDPTMSYVAPVIGYVSFADCQSKMASSTTHQLKDGNAVFTWNGEIPGVPNAWNITGVENGSYTFWTYERLYTRPTEPFYIIDLFGYTLIQAFQYAIVNTSPRTACLISEMNVYRNGDGGDVYHY